MYAVAYRWRSKAQNFQTNMLAILAERKSTYAMINNNLRSLVKAARFVRKGNVVRAWKALGQSPRSRKFKRPDTSGRWLELQYGWLPLIGDIYTIANADIPSSGYLRCSATIKRSGSHSDVNSWNAISGYRLDWDYSLKSKVTVSGFVSFDKVATAAQFGLTNPLLVAWEVVPFSFVVDWFLPIGSYLEGLTALHGLKLSDTSTTVHRSVKFKGELKQGPASAGVSYYRQSGITSGERYMIERTLGIPALPLPKLKSPFSVAHGLNAIALLRQLLRD